MYNVQYSVSLVRTCMLYSQYFYSQTDCDKSLFCGCAFGLVNLNKSL